MTKIFQPPFSLIYVFSHNAPCRQIFRVTGVTLPETAERVLPRLWIRMILHRLIVLSTLHQSSKPPSCSTPILINRNDRLHLWMIQQQSKTRSIASTRQPRRKRFLLPSNNLMLREYVDSFDAGFALPDTAHPGYACVGMVSEEGDDLFVETFVHVVAILVLELFYFLNVLETGELFCEEDDLGF